MTPHFLAPDERERTLWALHDRLKPGAPFVAAHSAFPQEEPERARWLASTLSLIDSGLSSLS